MLVQIYLSIYKIKKKKKDKNQKVLLLHLFTHCCKNGQIFVPAYI